MSTQSTTPRRLGALAVAFVVLPSVLAPAASAAGYRPVGSGATLVPGSGVVRPALGGPTTPYTAIRAWGKESVNNLNVNSSPTAISTSPEQVQQWDGWGAVVDGRNHSGTRNTATLPDGEDIDALANTRDALFADVLQDRTSLVFSVDDEAYGWNATGTWGKLNAIPSVGPLTTAASQTIGGAGEITRSVYGSGGFNRWSIQAAVDGRAYPTAPPIRRDLAGLELWGKGVDNDPALLGDADKYSLEGDARQTDGQGTWSVWNADGTGYLRHSDVVQAVTDLLGPLTAGASDLIDLDAVMVRDGSGNPNRFDLCRGPDCTFAPTRGVDQEGVPLNDGPFGVTVPDMVIFSIQQVPGATPGSYYATGSELIVLNQYGGASFLNQGGHLWDSAFAMNNLSVVGLNIHDPQQGVEYAVLDINALEAIGDLVEAPILPGDFNRDGAVDAGDYTVWRDGLGEDFDLDDYVTWSGGYGGSGIVPVGGVGPIAAAVPEPTAACLLGGLAAGSLIRRRR